MIPLSVFIEGAETMEKLTDAEVATALEKCVCGRATDCDSCQFRKKEYCKDDMLREAYDLIKRKDAEIERLKAEIRNTDNALVSLDRPLIEVKIEAYKEFADRLKNKATLKTRVEMHPSPYLGVKPVLQKPEYVIESESFDNILKELTEGSKNELQV